MSAGNSAFRRSVSVCGGRLVATSTILKFLQLVKVVNPGVFPPFNIPRFF